MNHRDFWYATYTLYSVSERTESEERLSDSTSASSGSEQALGGGRQHTMVSFLKPVLKQIIMAGKSMQLLQNLRCARRAGSPGAAPGRPPRLAWPRVLLQSLQGLLIQYRWSR